VVHLVEEDLLAGLLQQRVKAKVGLFHHPHLAPKVKPRTSQGDTGLCGFPSWLRTVESCPQLRSALATNRPTRWATQGVTGPSSCAAIASVSRMEK
jgi:hypothetical protein